jgi:hypothetical protein
VNLTKISISDKPGTRHSIDQSVDRIPAPRARPPVTWVALDDDGSVNWPVARRRVGFSPANVQCGDRIGCFTVVSNPELISPECVRVGHPDNCRIDIEHATYWGYLYAVHSIECPEIAPELKYWVADVCCNCGTVIENLRISGGWYQWIACRACYRSMRYPTQGVYGEVA